ncbi:cytochrome c oxidase assembly protein [Microbacterium imperiale]|uniref:cytochrome c oxidase assembly protein n=1 Tax=Microbacterium imperiale TaxID=33884 RepID=UPI001FDA52EB|nr:cytochrome c oxidase assembly protein [Microbacterium imperiale]BFE41140.1 hypothetical protein GCM10017544_20960 [Microbacterium imperiale]
MATAPWMCVCRSRPARLLRRLPDDGHPTLIDGFAGPTSALGIDPIEDQRLAGGLAWSYGEAPTLLMLIFGMHRRFRADTAQAVATDRRADAHGDPELDAYNDYLTRLHQKDS